MASALRVVSHPPAGPAWTLTWWSQRSVLRGRRSKVSRGFGPGPCAVSLQSRPVDRSRSDSGRGTPSLAGGAVRRVMLPGVLSGHSRHPEGHRLIPRPGASSVARCVTTASVNKAGHSSRAAPALLEHSRHECTISEGTGYFFPTMCSLSTSDSPGRARAFPVVPGSLLLWSVESSVPYSSGEGRKEIQ